MYIHKHEVNQQIDKISEENIIQPAISLGSNPLQNLQTNYVSVENKNWEWLQTNRSKYSLTNMNDLADEVRCCNYFPTFDLSSMRKQFFSWEIFSLKHEGLKITSLEQYKMRKLQFIYTSPAYIQHQQKNTFKSQLKLLED